MSKLYTVMVERDGQPKTFRMRICDLDLSDPKRVGQVCKDAIRGLVEDGLISQSEVKGATITNAPIVDEDTIPVCRSHMPLSGGDHFIAVDARGHVALFTVEKDAAPGSRAQATAEGYDCFLLVDLHNQTVLHGANAPADDEMDRIDVETLVIVHDGISPNGDGSYEMVGFAEPVRNPTLAFETLAFNGLARHSPRVRDAVLLDRLRALATGLSGRIAAARSIDFLDRSGNRQSVSFDPPAIVEILDSPSDLLERKGDIDTFDPVFPVRIVEDFAQTPEGLDDPRCYGPAFHRDGTIREGDFEINQSTMPVTGSFYSRFDIQTLIDNATRESTPNPDSPWAFKP